MLANAPSDGAVAMPVSGGKQRHDSKLAQDPWIALSTTFPSLPPQGGMSAAFLLVASLRIQLHEVGQRACILHMACAAEVLEHLQAFTSIHAWDLPFFVRIFAGHPHKQTVQAAFGAAGQVNSRDLTLTAHSDLACCDRCHSDDPKHKLTTCHKPCARLLECGHPCEAVCGREPCPPCRRLVTITLDCGHNLKVRCAQMATASQSLCTEMVDITMSDCGHKLRIPCGSVPEVTKCGLAHSQDLYCFAPLCLTKELTSCA